MMTAEQIRWELDEANRYLSGLRRETPEPTNLVASTLGRIAALQDVLGDRPQRQPDEPPPF